MSRTVSFPLAALILLIGGPDAAASSGAPAPSGGYASEVPEHQRFDNSDGSALAGDGSEGSIPVAEELDYVGDNDFRDRAGYDEALKHVAAINYYGTRYIGCEQYRLEVDNARPSLSHILLRTDAAADTFEIGRPGEGVVIHGEPQGLSADDERALLETFDFDTPVLQLKANPEALQPLGMQKLAGVLTWKLRVNRPGNYRRIIYVDSHTGDLVQASIVDAKGKFLLDIVQHDFRVVQGIRIPFAIDYKDPAGNLLASDRIERAEIIPSKSPKTSIN